MNLELTGEQLGIEDDELFSVEFTATLDDDLLENDEIFIEEVSNHAGYDALHLVDQDYAKPYIRRVLENMRDNAKAERERQQAEG